MSNDLTYFNKNFPILEVFYPKLAQKVKEKTLDNKDLQIMKAKTGDWTGKVILKGREVYLHSRFDPRKEAIHQIERFDLSTSRIWLLLGIGLGYQLFELLKRIDRRSNILVIEKRVDVFKESLSIFDWTEILQMENVELIIGEELEDVFHRIRKKFGREIFKRDIQPILHIPSVNLYPNYYAIFRDEKRLSLIKSFLKTPITTWKEFWKVQGEIYEDPIILSGYVHTVEDPFEPYIIEAMVNDIKEKLGLEKNHNLLDVGCGCGLLATKLKVFVKKIIGVDFSETMLRHIEKKTKVVPVVSEAHLLPFSNDKFDRVLCYATFPCFPNIRYAIECILELLRVTRPGGRIMIGDIPDSDLAEEEIFEKIKYRKVHTPKQIPEILKNNLTSLRYSRDFFRKFFDVYGNGKHRCSIMTQKIKGKFLSNFRFDVRIDVG